MRPLLNKSIQPEDFQNFYWLKKELQQFCRANGLSASGSKLDITARIITFLETGEIIKPTRTHKQKAPVGPLSIHTIITEGHTCSQNVRHFFKQHIPNFHFSTAIQNYFKENVGKTYEDVLHFWHEEQQRIKDPNYKKELGAQFEYNQFMRDYYADPINKGKSSQEAIEVWKTIKNQPGDHKYKPC